MSLKDQLLQNNDIELISMNDINIEFDPNKTIGYDFTVEDYFTFAIEDGLYVQDTMSIVHPLSNESQADVKKKMMRGEGFASSSSTNLSISKEMCVGLYLLTKDVEPKNSPISITQKDLDNANDPYIAVKYKGRITTMGKALLNSCLPLDYPFIDKQVKKNDINNLAAPINEKYGFEMVRDVFSRLEKLSFKFATIMAPSISIDDLELPPSILKIKEQLKTSTPEESAILMETAMKLMQEHLQGTSIYDIAESGSAKGWKQPLQILVAKGVLADTEGNLQTISGSFADGMSNQEYFNVSLGARKGICDRVLNTADTGYFSRQMAYVLNSVEADRTLKDCGTKRALTIRLKSDMFKKLKGRYIINDDGKVELFDPINHKDGDVVNFRSPVYCESKKICHTCYGKLLERIKSPYIGIIAGQTLGEVVTQSTMKTFHTGGQVDLIKRYILEDIIQNDPLISDINFLKKYLKQDKNFLYVLKDCKITIDIKEDYTETDQYNINEDDGFVYLKGVLLRIEFEDTMFNIILDYPANIKINDMSNNIINKNKITLFYNKNETILEIFTEASIITQQLQYVKRLLGGKEIYKNSEHMFMKLYTIYGAISSMDLVHLEVLLSQCLRYKKDLQLPARLGATFDPVMINIKQIVFHSSFLQGLAFENLNASISTGLISEEPDDPSILEKVLTGTLYEPTREELKRKERQKQKLR